jgi:hypothetical protein
MTRLAPNQRDKTYKQLVESALAQLPGLAPQWTDYNAHDPGIAILELLAWTTEAQIYALSRSRRGERSGYAKLLGAPPRGATSAKTLIWPKSEHAKNFRNSSAIDKNSRISVAAAPDLRFMADQDMHILAAHIASIRSVGPNEEVVDHGRPSNSDITPFLPFGPGDAVGWSLQLELVSNTNDPIFNNTVNVPCTFSLGFKAAKNISTEAIRPIALPEVHIVSSGVRRLLRVDQDDTQKLRQTGIMLLTVSENLPLSSTARLELSYPRGRGNRNLITHVAVNALPIQQATVHLGEAHVAVGSADETIRIANGFLVTDDAAKNISVKTWENGRHLEWKAVDDMSAASPDDRVFSLDIANQTLTVGNGINGKRLPALQDVVISYLSSEGEAGNVSAGASWSIDGVAGLEFSNFSAATGGTNIADIEYRQIGARKTAKSMGILSRTVDLEKAAEELQHLNVLVAATGVDESCARNIALTLFVLRHPSPDDTFAINQEPVVWADEIKVQLAPRIPLGIKFNVQSVPRSIFRIHAKCRIVDGAAPSSVQSQIRQHLEKRFGVAGTARDVLTKRIGRQLTRLDIIGLLQAITSVAIVENLTLSDSNGHAINKVDVSVNGRAVLDIAGSTFTLLSGHGGLAR